MKQRVYIENLELFLWEFAQIQPRAKRKHSHKCEILMKHRRHFSYYRSTSKINKPHHCDIRRDRINGLWDVFGYRQYCHWITSAYGYCDERIESKLRLIGSIKMFSHIIRLSCSFFGNLFMFTWSDWNWYALEDYICKYSKTSFEYLNSIHSSLYSHAIYPLD